MRRHPHLYEINTWPWLDRLSRRSGRIVTLASVPEAEWDALRARGIDIVYLMGIWTRSAFGRGIARSATGEFAGYDLALPGWRLKDVVGSAYCISGYEPDPRIGTLADVDRVRAALHARGMRLLLDFIPNHVGFDHPWTTTNPERFVTGTEEAFRHDPSAFRLVDLPSGDVQPIACARDPYFPPWTDVAQLDYSRDDTRRAMVDQLRFVAEHADGARCDMAMLVLSDVFEKTWGRAAPAGRREFWSDARDAVPGFLLVAEVYWDLEWRLQQLGFDYTYDKRLYDRLVDGHRGAADAVRGHLHADTAYQSHSARFIENHDEPRSAVEFGHRAPVAACVMSTLQGLRFYYDGQFEGRRVRLPVQLGVDAEEQPDAALSALYTRLLSIVDAPIFHDGEWTLCDVTAVDDSSVNLAAWRWTSAADLRVVVVNLGEDVAQGRVHVGDALPDGASLGVRGSPRRKVLPTGAPRRDGERPLRSVTFGPGPHLHRPFT